MGLLERERERRERKTCCRELADRFLVQIQEKSLTIKERATEREKVRLAIFFR